MNNTTDKTALAIAITSGKGGVGKTNITANLGIALARAGKKACVFDADTSLANINILLGLTPEYTLDHFLKGEQSIEDIMLHGPENLAIVPSATGIAEYANLSKSQQQKVLDALENLEQRFDYLLIDTAAGISDNVIRFIQSAQYAVVVISPEPTSLTDAFSLIKVLHRRDYQQPVYVLINMAANYTESMDVFKRFAHAVNKYVHIKVRYLGYIPMDKQVRHAVSAQSPLIDSAPDSPAGRCISLLANILIKHFTPNSAPVRKISQFWRAQGDAPITEPSTHSETTAEVATQSMNEQDSSNALEETQITSHNTEPEPANKRREVEEQLAELIKNYLTEFGTLPQQAIDMVLQAHAQGELPENATASLEQQFQAENGHSATPPEPATQYNSRIEQLAAEAERTKRELTEMATHLRDVCLDLYNVDVSRPRARLQNLHGKIARPDSTAKDEGMASAIRYASGIKGKPE